MVIQSVEYLTHFHNMLEEAMVCGLMDPREWIRNYSRGIGKLYTELLDIEEFCIICANELYCWTHLKELSSYEDFQKWINEC
jgi:hypothetical protein